MTPIRLLNKADGPLRDAMIAIENLTKSYGPQVLFDNISFKLNSRERVGLVGRNGHGKTTLFRIIIGAESADGGTVALPKNYRLGYVRQHIDFTENTVLAEGMKGLCAHEADHHWKVEKILAGLGFSEADMERNPLEFSGGYQVRLNFAKVLVSEPDLLLLDEPTNYLDITSIRWIKRFLVNWPRELMLITHDRGFMDAVVTHTVGIHRRKARKIEGNTEKYYAQIAQDEEVYEKTRINDEKRRKEIELFITRFRAKARLANMVQSRIKTLAKMEKKDKLDHIKTLDFSFRSRPFPGKQMMSVRDVSFSYAPDKPLIRNLDVAVLAGEKIGVIGKNGKGKTTLLKLLAGMLTPDRGEIVYNPNVVKGVYEQTNIATLADNRTVEEEIMYAAEDVDRQSARNVCGAMMFEGDAALKKISVLSGGEKSRVMLGKLLVARLNMLILDEPTNHLDMESSDSLLEAIDDFPGAVLMVTHNEMFLHALADRLIVFHENGLEVFEGGYQEFLDKGGWEDDPSAGRQETPSRAAPEENKPVVENISKKELRRRRSQIISRRSRDLKPLEDDISKTEGAIEQRESELNRLQQALQKASENGDGAGIAELSKSFHACQTAIDALYEDLENRTARLDEKGAAFDEELKKIDMMESG